MLFFEDDEIKQKAMNGEVCIQHFNRVHLLYSRELNQIIDLNCKSWRCPKHQKSWLHRWQVSVSRETEVNPVDKLITLTCASKATPEQLTLARQLLFREWRETDPDVSYVSVLEFGTKAKFPHLHLLARAKYLHQSKLSRLWAKSTKSAGIKRSPVVYIEAPRSQIKSVNYALKYALSGAEKGQAIPLDWRGRKITYSKNFFIAATPAQHWKNYLEEKFPNRKNTQWELRTLQEQRILAEEANRSDEFYIFERDDGQFYFKQI